MRFTEQKSHVQTHSGSSLPIKLYQVLPMDHQTPAPKIKLMLIDGGSVYPWLAELLGARFELTHISGKLATLELASESREYEGVIVDLTLKVEPEISVKTSIQGFCLVENLRAISECSSIPIAVVSHWPEWFVLQEARNQGVEIPDCRYFRMSDWRSLAKYFSSAE